MLFASITLAQSLSVVSGDAQLSRQGNPTSNPLVVIAKDAAGKPLQGVSVNWSVSGLGHLVPGNQTVTDFNGLTSVYFVGSLEYDGGVGFTQSTIVASIPASSVSMHVTAAGFNIATGVEYVRADVLAPSLGEVLSPPVAGGTAPFVEVQVTANAYAGIQPVPNVAIRLVPDHLNGPTLACAEGTGITGPTGIAHCVVVFGGAIGTDRFSVEVGGGFRTFGPFQFAVTQSQAQPAVLRITGGNNQAGLPGALLPSTLSARVEDTAGNPLPGVSVTWQPVVAQSVVLSNVVSTSDINGVVSARVALGGSVGTAQVQVRTTSGAQAIFSLTVRQPAPTGGQSLAAAIRILSGNNQSGPVGARLSVPLTARVEDAAGNPLPNVPVTWRPSPSVSLTSIVSTSDSSGVVSAFATPTSSTAPVQVELQTQGGVQTPFGVAAVTILVTFNIVISAGSPPVVPPTTPPPSVSTGYIAHIADGAEWKTTITVVNLLSVPQRITLSFWASSGVKWSLPIVGGGVSQQTYFDLQPNASGFLETSGTAASVSTGWATVEGSVSGSSGVGASAIFRSHVSGRQDSEAVSAMGIASPRGLILPFDNRNGFATGVAIANAGGSGVVPITIRDGVGSVILTDNLALVSSAHLSFSLTDRYPALIGRVGTMEIGSGGAAALGLRFNPSGSFTSVPPIPKP
jgi:hypothetical protein